MIRRIAAFAAGLALFATPLVSHGADLDVRDLLNHCIGCNLAGKDMRGADLHGISMIGANLRRVNLDGAHLSDIRFTGVDLDDANLDNSDLRGAQFVGASLRGTTFAHANLDGATFTGVSLTRTNLVDGNKRGLIRTCTGCNLEGIDLSGADLRSIKFVGSNLRDAKLVKTDLRDAQLVGANMRSSDLSGAQLSGGVLVGTNMSGATVHGAAFGNVELCSRNHNYYNKISTGNDETVCANLTGIDFHRIDLSQVQWCDRGLEHNADRTSCRTVTRAELVDIGHANLAGATGPAN
jgi:uncharacterized protein YjbI with pentapeptide repeats